MSDLYRRFLRNGFCLLLALLLLVSALPAMADAGNETQTAEPDAEVWVGVDGYDVPRLVAGTYTDKKITTREEALDAAKLALEYLKAGTDRELEQHLDPICISDLTVYVFTEKKNGQPVENSYLKILVNAEGTVLGAVSALSNGETPSYAQEAITPEEAQEVVRKEYPDTEFEMIVSEALPQLLSDDGTRETPGKIRSVYRVYTNNPDDPERYRYLVHFVEVTGDYLFAMTAEDVVQGTVPDQEFNHEEIFRNESLMATSVTYKPVEAWKDYPMPESVTLDVLQDQDGKYYMIDPVRHFAVADYYDFTFPAEKTISVFTFQNPEDLSQEIAMLYYNFSRVYDFYAGLGWKGPDGKGTDTLLLYYYCDENKNPSDNAFYEGFRKYGYQIFTFGTGYGDAYTTDIIAHEYTHCVTRMSLVEGDYYHNEQGAINEAMSDILGYLADAKITGEDGQWLMARYALKPIRSFAEPEQFKQPACRWDRCYVAPTYLPDVELNDYGGVHINSSLVNRIAYLLCEEGGMSKEDAVRLWTYADMALTGKTDFAGLADTLKWALHCTGLDAYAETLQKAVEATGLQNAGMPENALDGTVIVRAPVVIGENENEDMFEFASEHKLMVAGMQPSADFNGYNMVTASIGLDGGYRFVLPADTGGTAAAILIVYCPGEKELAVFHPQESMWKIVSVDTVLPGADDPNFTEILKTAAETYSLTVESGQILTVEIVPLLRYLAQ